MKVDQGFNKTVVFSGICSFDTRARVCSLASADFVLLLIRDAGGWSSFVLLIKNLCILLHTFFCL